MSASKLIFYAMRERYQTQRDRREQIRNSIATPVTAMAFSVYTLAWVTGRIDVTQWQHPIGFATIVLAVISVLCLLAGAVLIVRMYRELISLIEEEHRATEMLDLPLPPRLCVVDEVRVAMLRPSDRTLLLSDKEMRRAREDAQRDKQRQESRRLRGTEKPEE